MENAQNLVRMNYVEIIKKSFQMNRFFQFSKIRINEHEEINFSESFR